MSVHASGLAITHSVMQVPASAFIRIARYWRFLSAERESGQALNIDEFVQHRPQGSFAEVCMACPVPGLNTPEASWPANSRRASENEDGLEEDL